MGTISKITMVRCPRCEGAGKRCSHPDSGMYNLNTGGICMLCKGSGKVRSEVASAYEIASQREHARLRA